jgi:hypothetical protein
MALSGNPHIFFPFVVVRTTITESAGRYNLLQKNLCDKDHRRNVRFVFTSLPTVWGDLGKLFGSVLQPGGKPGSAIDFSGSESSITSRGAKSPQN